jgi:plastocyanin
LSFRFKAGLAAAVAVLAVPASASAATKTVNMGLPTAQQKTFQKAFADVNDFFPHGTTIHVGDSIKFAPTGFHTVDIPRKGGSALALFLPTGQSVTGPTGLDAAGAPFWFNNTQQNIGFNPVLGPPGLFGKKATYTGAKRIESGLPFAQKPKSFTVKFTKTGTYTYYCDIHHGMKGSVKVVSKNSSVPSTREDKRDLNTQIASTLKTAKKLIKTTATANTVSVGASGAGGVESFAFYPSNLSVKAGTTVTFRMSSKTFDDHTATTGPGNPETEPNSYLGSIEAGFEGPVLDARAVYPSDAPGSIAALTPTFHGNGFWSSGVMDRSSTTPQVPSSNSVNFSAPGTYQFYCMIHPFMHATVTVTP